ncbi:MAG TPA: hypothetical protein VGN44_20055, partial [Candidatus Angelobacter sp.]
MPGGRLSLISKLSGIKLSIVPRFPGLCADAQHTGEGHSRQIPSEDLFWACGSILAFFAQPPFRSVLTVLISGEFDFQLPIPAILAILAIPLS